MCDIFYTWYNGMESLDLFSSTDWYLAFIEWSGVQAHMCMPPTFCQIYTDDAGPADQNHISLKMLCVESLTGVKLYYNIHYSSSI